MKTQIENLSAYQPGLNPEELKKSSEKKLKALKYQKYYTGGAIVLMFLVLISMYLILN